MDHPVSSTKIDGNSSFKKKQIKMNNSLLDLVESSPLVQAQKIIKTPNVKLYFKMEGHNPGGSNKDQAAYNMIDAAFKRGEINKDLQLIESTSDEGMVVIIICTRGDRYISSDLFD
ncbi:hypothetical protein QYM36_012540 [Artemia franciscana]|uniref:Tryptophan synthase beta chain-like PALP domain-containing protein n=1 Tax=Artemia franciscana TaxID=6661 RepID=A0AA88L7Y0_ARTSF|nr:hypothetical protein QYM36_012540 [Artemia franciscana]